MQNPSPGSAWAAVFPLGSTDHSPSAHLPSLSSGQDKVLQVTLQHAAWQLELKTCPQRLCTVSQTYGGFWRLPVTHQCVLGGHKPGAASARGAACPCRPASLPEAHLADLQRVYEMLRDAETQGCTMEKTAMETSTGSSHPGAHHPWVCAPAAHLLLAVQTFCYFSQSLGMASPPHFSGCVARSWRLTAFPCPLHRLCCTLQRVRVCG